MNFMFAAGSTNEAQNCLDVTIDEDVLVEGSETFIVTLTLGTTGVGVTLANSMTTVTIMDNEGWLS